MADTAADEARKEARDALKPGLWESFGGAAKATAWFVAPLGLVGGALKAFNIADASHVFVALGFWLLTFPIGIVAHEFRRQRRVQKALEEVIRTEKLYEDLLRDERKTRDEAKQEIAQLQSRLALREEAAVLTAEIRRFVEAGAAAVDPEAAGRGERPQLNVAPLTKEK